jgi:2-isopropylmalate synthase
VHVAAIRRHAMSYQHVDPAAVGNECRVVVSELSGRANLVSKAEEHGVAVDEHAPTEALRLIKEQEARGFSYEAAEASVALLLARHAPGYHPPFQLVDYKILTGQASSPGHPSYAEAMVKLSIDGRTTHTAAEGEGPVHALDAALRKALAPHFSRVTDIHLADYKVRILDGNAGTRAVTRVLIDFADGEHRWSTVGASASIIEATWLALVDGIEYGLTLGATPRAHQATPHRLEAQP